MKKNFIKAVVLSIILAFIFVSCSEKKLTKEEMHQKQIESLFINKPPHGYHKTLVNLVLSQLNDPNSFDHLGTYYIERDTTLVVEMDFTAKNGFGGAVRQKVIIESDTLGNITKIYKWF